MSFLRNEPNKHKGLVLTVRPCPRADKSEGNAGARVHRCIAEWLRREPTSRGDLDSCNLPTYINTMLRFAFRSPYERPCCIASPRENERKRGSCRARGGGRRRRRSRQAGCEKRTRVESRQPNFATLAASRCVFRCIARGSRSAEIFNQSESVGRFQVDFQTKLASRQSTTGMRVNFFSQLYIRACSSLSSPLLPTPYSHLSQLRDLILRNRTISIVALGSILNFPRVEYSNVWSNLISVAINIYYLQW